MILTGDQISSLLYPEHPSDLLKFGKPRPFSQLDQAMRAMLPYLHAQGGRAFCHAGRKKDGFSVTVECAADGSCVVKSRTPFGTERLALNKDEARRFVTALAVEMQVQLKCELVGYIDGEEVGYTGVLSVLKLFKQGDPGGRTQLRLHVFGVHSAGGRPADLVPPEDLANLLHSFLVEGNGFAAPIECEKYLMELHTDKGHTEIAFRSEDGGTTYAHNPAQFAQFLLDKASCDGAEGYVLSLPAEAFRLRPVEIDSFGTGRFSHLVKIKQENPINILVCRVLEYKISRSSNKKFLAGSHIYLYGRSSDERLSFVGTATGHKRLEAMLPTDKFAFKFCGKDQKRGLYSLERTVLLRLAQEKSAIQINTLCNAFSPNKYAHVEGLKYYMMRMPDLDFNILTNTVEVAIQNDHFLAIRAAHEKLAVYTGRRAALSSESEDDGAQSPARGSPASPAGTTQGGSPPDSPAGTTQGGSPPDSPAGTTQGGSPPDSPTQSFNGMPSQSMLLSPLPSAATLVAAPSVAQSSQPSLVYRQLTTRLSPSEKLVYVDALAVPPEDMPSLLAKIPAGWGLMTDTDRPTDVQQVVGVFSRSFINRQRSPGNCFFFLQNHPNATLVTADEIEGALNN